MVSTLSANLALNEHDIHQPRHEYLFKLPDGISQWLTQKILKRQDPNNLFILYVMVNILLTIIPFAVMLYLLEPKIPPILMFPLGILYLYLLFTKYARSFILGLHYSTHASIFNKKWGFLRQISSNFLCAFFGIPPMMYYAHHIAMHHCEDNQAPYDLSSTMHYQRDSKLEHFKYMLRFVLVTWVELPYILIKKNRYKFALNCLIGEAIFLAGTYTLFLFSPIATIIVFIVPNIFISFALMQGNWKQHIFVDPEEPDNNYKSTFTCINTVSNSFNFNDGYHVEHHENPAMPWYKLPQYFQGQLEQYAANDGFIFTGISSTEVGSLVLNGQLEQLANHYVNVGQKKRTKAELIEEFRRRLVKIEKI
jgi:fatty acid desaturase